MLGGSENEKTGSGYTWTGGGCCVMKSPTPVWAPFSLRFPLHSIDPSAQLNPRKSYDFLRETPFGHSWSIGYSSIDCAMLRALLRPRHVCLRATETRTLSKSWIWMCPWPTNALAETEESMIPSVSTICLRESQK